MQTTIEIGEIPCALRSCSSEGIDRARMPVLILITSRQSRLQIQLTAMDCRVECFHSASQHFRGFCDIGDIPDQVLDVDVPGHMGTHSMGMPASLIFFAVPPDPRRRTPRDCRPLAKSKRPVLSYTDSKASYVSTYKDNILLKGTPIDSAILS